MMKTISTLLCVFLGGGLGSIGRYLVAVAMKKHQLLLGGLPIHTLLVNVVGSLLIGLLMGCLSKNPSHWLQMLLVVGFCGGFTTFSTFSFEVMEFLKIGNTLMALLYVLLSLSLCVLMTTLGFVMTRA